jgi:hypothetical protein
MRTKLFNLTIINAYAPTEDKDELTKDQFYYRLEQAYETIPSNDVKIFVGDLNTQDGEEEAFQNTTGLHSLHDTSNDNGQWLTDFATSKNMVISSTSFPRKEIHKHTWVSPDGLLFNQNDHLLLEGEHQA